MSDNYYNVEWQVEVRANHVDSKALVKCLREHKTMSNKEIASKLNVPVTLVEHWFRQDRYQAIPTPQMWIEIKKLFDIETDEFDSQIMQFEQKASTYDMQNRIYYGKCSPTLSCDCGNKYFLVKDDD